MTLIELLAEKGTNVISVCPTATLHEAINVLAQHNVGSVVVCAGPPDEPCDMIGILSERDVLRAYSKNHDLSNTKVSDVMTHKVIAGSPNDSVEHAMGLMTKHRIRHLPIVDDGRLRGIISIGDLVKTQYRQFALENEYLKTYIQS